MTLVLALVGENEFHMTCDFRLTNAINGEPMPVMAHKLIRVGSGSGQFVVGVTGSATLDGLPIGEWIVNATNSIRFDSTFEDLVAALRTASNPLSKVRPSHRKYRRITFVICGIDGSQSVVTLLSNFQDFKGGIIDDDATPEADLRLVVARPSNPRLIVAGQTTAVRKEERKSLERSLRSGISAGAVRERMAALNKTSVD